MEMAGNGVAVHLSGRARDELRPGEALVFDWHRVAMCCAVGVETSLRRTTLTEVRRSRVFVPVGADPVVPVYAHRQVVPALAAAGGPVRVDCHRRLGMRHFTADLPTDFGLRATLSRLPG
jgi:hypothetical protein